MARFYGKWTHEIGADPPCVVTVGIPDVTAYGRKLRDLVLEDRKPSEFDILSALLDEAIEDVTGMETEGADGDFAPLDFKANRELALRLLHGHMDYMVIYGKFAKRIRGADLPNSSEPPASSSKPVEVIALAAASSDETSIPNT